MPFLPLLPELDQLLMPFQTMDRRPVAHYMRKNLSLALALAKLRSPPTGVQSVCKGRQRVLEPEPMMELPPHRGFFCEGREFAVKWSSN